MKTSNVLGSLTALSLLAAVGCTSGGGDAPAASPGITISGTLGASQALSMKAANDVGSWAVTLSDLEIYATCFSNPPAIAQGNVSATGTFSVSLNCPAGSFVSGLFRDKTNYESVGLIQFVDTSASDMSGAASGKTTTSIALSGAVSLGAITLGSDGKVSIPVSQIQTSVTSSDTVSAATAFDFHGVWTAAPFAGTLPKGYATACASNAQNCDGPFEGMPITLIRLAGKKFTPAAGKCTVTNGQLSGGGCLETDGTVGTEDAYGISIWGGGATTWPNVAPFNGADHPLKSCGYKLGFTAAEARAYAKLHVASAPTIATNPILLQAFSFTTPSGFAGDACTHTATGDSVGCNQKWMKTGATARWPMQNCAVVTKSANSISYDFMVCKGTATVNGSAGTVTYNAFPNNGGGCVDSTTNKPIRVENWGSITSSTCGTPTPHAVTGVTTGYCDYVNQVPVSGGSPASFRCTWSNGFFSDAAMTTAVSNVTNYTPGELVTSGGNCKDIDVSVDGAGGAVDPAKQLMRMRCYASNMEGGGGKMTGCEKEYRFNWGAALPADFVQSGREKPDAAFVTNVGTYSSDGNTFMVNDIQHDSGSVFVDNKSIICEIEKFENIVASKITNSQLKIDVSGGGRLLSLDKPACRAVADCVGKLYKAAELAGTTVSNTDMQTCSNNGDVAWRLKPEKMVFLLNKSSN